jgi:hypothetical protein
MHVLTTAPRLSRWAQVLRQPAPRSPLTREALRSEVVPNHALRKRIEEHEIELDCPIGCAGANQLTTTVRGESFPVNVIGLDT